MGQCLEGVFEKRPQNQRQSNFSGSNAAFAGSNASEEDRKARERKAEELLNAEKDRKAKERDAEEALKAETDRKAKARKAEEALKAEEVRKAKERNAEEALNAEEDRKAKERKAEEARKAASRLVVFNHETETQNFTDVKGFVSIEEATKGWHKVDIPNLTPLDSVGDMPPNDNDYWTLRIRNFDVVQYAGNDDLGQAKARDEVRALGGQILVKRKHIKVNPDMTVLARKTEEARKARERKAEGPRKAEEPVVTRIPVVEEARNAEQTLMTEKARKAFEVHGIAGYLDRKGIIESKSMTPSHAKDYAYKLPNCIGFNYQGAANQTDEITIHFMNTWDFHEAEGWTSIRRTVTPTSGPQIPPSAEQGYETGRYQNQVIQPPKCKICDKKPTWNGKEDSFCEDAECKRAYQAGR